PDLVILSTWMAASPKHIQKYTSHCQTTYPQTPLLVLTNSISDITLRSSAYHRKHLSAAASVIRKTYQEQNGGANILLHSFSNGGTHHICQLAKLYRSQFSQPLPISGAVLDSAPGTAAYKTGLAALSANLPPFLPFRILTLCFIHIVCISTWFSQDILGLENVITRTRREINDPKLFDQRGKRVYIYSREDALVGWRDVEANAEEARKGGWDVQLERFDGSRHVGHVVADPARYWSTV
ncbi:hypothetical protein EJ08DRAFT_569241, partial [Tothia fuscella]